MIYAVMGVQFFSGEQQWARGNAVWVKQNTETLAQQSALVAPGLSEELTSWFGAFEVDDEGNLTLVEAWHLDEDANVKPGLPKRPNNPGPPNGGGDGEGPEAWQEWDGVNENLYQVGDVVMHNGQTWIATVGNNHWEPGEYGWEVQ